MVLKPMKRPSTGARDRKRLNIFQSKAKKIIHLPEVPENKQYLEALYTVGTVQIGSQIPNNVEDLYVFRTTSEKYEGIDTQVSGLPPFSSWSFELGRGGIPLLIQLSKHLRESLTQPREPDTIVILQREVGNRYLPSASKICELVNSTCVILDIKPSTKLRDIAKILSSAKILIGVHGAGLTHSILLQPDAIVIEILLRGSEIWKGGYHKADYFNLAASLNLRYFYFDSVGVTREKGKKRISVLDVFVDVNQIVTKINELT
ncbi:hypothetical protein TrVE_jg9406 [Triparma verrucosa]|uniref:Glycosyltransferase 61 catalytic domain-containing protein n=1 Tax=Triparma verrucosa TaxID=1606542 RepID=A0A9W7F8J0_9STRA|nr:hypothetical protein TrVE_jg9406 [Triparma verrucosa]